MTRLQSIPDELAITIGNGDVWLSIALALLLGAACWMVGTWVARTVGLLEPGAPAGETLGVGLSVGLMVIAAWWAAIWSGGRSSFTPVAIGMALTLGLAYVHRARGASETAKGIGNGTNGRLRRHGSLIVTAIGAGVFVIAVALLYGSTIAPSPRAGVQPVEFNDVAFYAVLGRDLVTTGTESNLLASGFSEIPGVSAQTWYHWGELWLASATIKVFGTAPLAARYFIVLPLVLLAAAAMTGTIVRRMAKTPSRGAYALGVLVCLLLAPVPLIPGPFFSSWAAGMIFGINVYGLAAVAVPLALYSVAVLSRRHATWALAGFVGSVVAFILPAHLAVALLAVVGVGTVWTIRLGQAARARRWPVVPGVWRRTLVSSGVLLGATVIWGLLTDHSLGGGGGAPPIVGPFNDSWRASVAITTLGGGAFFAIAVGWFLVRRRAPVQADLYLATGALLVAGAIGWGARLGDFTMFYLFYAGIAVIATPVAAIAVRAVWERLRATQHLRLAAGLVVLCVIQLALGGVTGMLRLESFGPKGTGDTIPIGMLGAIRQLPPDAKLAYTCQPFSESGFGVPQLLSIDAHTARRVVPMCFEAEVLSTLIGAEPSVQVRNLFFSWAPQRVLYPDSTAAPSSAIVTAFLNQYGIDYIYADANHSNALAGSAESIVKIGDAELFGIP